jgi:hypothetical protein
MQMDLQAVCVQAAVVVVEIILLAALAALGM